MDNPRKLYYKNVNRIITSWFHVFQKNGIGVHTAEISLILCQNYAMCHVCLWFMKKWLKICKKFNSQHWKSFFWLTYSLNKNFTKARPWGLRPCSKRVPKSTNLWTTPPIYEFGRYLRLFFTVAEKLKAKKLKPRKNSSTFSARNSRYRRIFPKSWPKTQF